MFCVNTFCCLPFVIEAGDEKTALKAAARRLREKGKKAFGSQRGDLVRGELLASRLNLAARYGKLNRQNAVCTDGSRNPFARTLFPLGLLVVRLCRLRLKRIDLVGRFLSRLNCCLVAPAGGFCGGGISGSSVGHFDGRVAAGDDTN